MHVLEGLAAKMDVICRKRLPDGLIRAGNLAGKESEIRQLALTKAIGGFIQQNSGYIEAVKANDDVSINLAMEKCVAIRLRYAKMQIARETTLTASRYIPLDEKNGGVCHHPSDLDSLDWPPDVKAGVVIESVRRAVTEGQLSVGNAIIVDLVCDENLSVAQVGHRLKITPEAVRQQLRRVKRVLPQVIESTEVQWDFLQ